MKDVNGRDLKKGDYILYASLSNDRDYFFKVSSTNNNFTKVKNMEGKSWIVSIPERIKLLSDEEALLQKC
jgi:hypothetical protein